MTQSNLTDALAYSHLGWHVFPCHPETKAPLVPRGFHSATTDEATITAWWTERPTASVGVACRASELTVIDLDVNHENGRNGILAWKFLQQDRGDDEATLIARTKRGGHHIIYRRPTADHVTTTDNIIPGSGIDVRGDGGYFIAPSACEPSRQWDVGDPFEDGLTPPPHWIVSMVSTEKVIAGNPDGGMFNKEMPLSPEEVSQIRSALDKICCEEHDVWIRVGMALKSTGARDQALGLWAEWSQESPKWDEEAALKRWASMREFRFDGTEIKIGTLFKLARDNGWDGVEPMLEQVVEAPEPAAPAAKKEVGERVRPFPMELLNFPGLVSDAAYGAIRSGRHAPQPALAFASGLALTAAVLGRRVEDKDGLRTNLFIGLLAETGAGKDKPLKFPSEVLMETGVNRLMDRVGPSDWSSDTALRRVIQTQPTMIATRDEMGIWFRILHDPRATSASNSAKSLFLSLHSASRGSVLKGTAFANGSEKPQVDLYEPCFVFLGAGTPATCFKAAGAQGMEDGFINRFLMVRSDEIAPKPLREEEVEDYPSLRQVAESARRVDRYFGEPGTITSEHCDGPPARKPTQMEWSPEAASLILSLEEQNNTERNESKGDSVKISLLARKLVNVKKVAMVLSGGQDLSQPISEEAVKAADLFVSWCCDRTLQELRRYIGRSDYEVSLNEFCQGLAAYEGRFRRQDIMRDFRSFGSRATMDMLNHLIMSCEVRPDGDDHYIYQPHKTNEQ